MKQFVFGIALAVLFAGSASANETYVQTSVEQGPAVVVDSWMKPTVVRTREVKDADGNSQLIQEPMIMERHEHVVVPTTETPTTTSVSQEPTVIRRETNVINEVAVQPKKSVKPKRKQVRRTVAHKPRAVALRKPQRAKRKYVAQRVVEERIEAPTVIEQTQRSVLKETLIERRHPALDL